MLKLNRSHNFSISFPAHSGHKLAFSPVRSERDELIQAIEASRGEARWQLTSVPDVRQLDEFWTGVAEDLRKDPSWFSFADD